MYTGVQDPSTPESVAVSQISSDGFTVKWTVHSVSYTPETYLIEYGTTSDFLLPSRNSVTSGTDISVVNKTYRIELKELSPGKKYYFVVVARNSARITRTTPLFIHTKETSKIPGCSLVVIMECCFCPVPGKVSFVTASRVNDSSLNISWGAVEAANGNLTHYEVWVNSTSEGHQRLVNISLPRRLIVSGLSKSLLFTINNYEIRVNISQGQLGRWNW